MQMTQNSKHNSAGFNKRLQILNGDDLSPKHLWSENADLKFNTSNEKEDDSKKPCNRKHIALPSEDKAVNKRQRRGYRDYRHEERQQQNTGIASQTKPIYEERERRLLNAAESEEERQQRADWTFKVKIMFFDATIGSKNYTICKIQSAASQTKIFDERMCTQGRHIRMSLTVSIKLIKMA